MSIRRMAIGAGVILALVIGAAPVGAALPGFAWPVQSEGNRGSDVLAIQSLLRGHGIGVRYDGLFSANTTAGVRSFQGQVGLRASGIVDHTTWARLVTRVGPGARGEAVLTLQRQLNAKRSAGLATTGVYDAPTTNAVRTLERHVGLSQDGIADATLWRYLIAHFGLPSFSSSGLCDYSVGNGPANWGTGAAIGQVVAAGRTAAGAGYGGLALGDIGHEHGGDIAGHTSHEVGLDVDVRPIRDHRNQCLWGTNWRSASYDRTSTRELVKAIRAAAAGHVKLIYFNDPVLIREGWTSWYPGHDDHLHVRYCEVALALAAYRC